MADDAPVCFKPECHRRRLLVSDWAGWRWCWRHAWQMGWRPFGGRAK